MKSTLGNVLAASHGVGRGFDFLRIFLAFSIVFVHSFLLSGNDVFFRSSLLWFGEYSLVPMFFALSGFLIAGSAKRLNLKNFLLNRGLRIFPALAVDIVVCALIIGPLLTDEYLKDYFSSATFFRYFLNIFGRIHYELPGVFGQNPTHQVNGALWTVPWELLCYIIMSLIMVTGIINSFKMLLIVLVAFFLCSLFVGSFGYALPQAFASPAHTIFISWGSRLIIAFLLGIGAYQIRDWLPYSKSLFAISVLIVAVSVVVLNPISIEYTSSRVFVLIPLVYITVFIGVTPMPLPALFHKGDYSYGIYLYHDPFLQILVQLFPGLFLIPKFGAVALFAIGSIPAMAIAIFSWHFIEKPILTLRKKFSFVAKARGVTDTSMPPLHREETGATGSLDLKRTN